MSRGSGQGTRGVGRTTAALGLALLGALVVPGSAAGSARMTAEPGASDIRVGVTELAPTSLPPDGTLVVGARVVNASDVVLVDVGARLRIGSEPITSRAQLADFAAGSEEVGLVPDTSLVDVAPELAPGEAADVRIEVPADELGLVPGFGVHPLTIELRVAEPDGTRRTAGSARTFVVTSGTGDTPTVRVAWLWPLVGTPGRGPDGVLPPTTATKPGRRPALRRSARRAARGRDRPPGHLARRRRAARGRPIPRHRERAATRCPTRPGGRLVARHPGGRALARGQRRRGPALRGP